MDNYLSVLLMNLMMDSKIDLGTNKHHMKQINTDGKCIKNLIKLFIKIIDDLAIGIY